MTRQDGRGPEKLRKVTITRNYIKHAEGSCLIELGNTRVVCTATLEENVPPFLKGSGNGWFTAEYGMLPRSTVTRINRERDKISGRTFEIQRLIGRSLRAVFNTKKIGERTIKMDCDVIQADGGTRTASITGSFIALVDCLQRMKKDGAIEELPIRDYIAATSVGIYQTHPILDLTYEEDSKAEVDMNVVMTGKGEFVEIQGTAEGKTFSKVQMEKLLAVAKKGIDDLVDIERNLFKDIL
ncbi:MAG: ribonuclease PH [Candidatus Omnitrophica bacterium]|nr:ribonuclease PH [Candidatus Omnitrophota bacterium]